jgi:hypothetical protein
MSAQTVTGWYLDIEPPEWMTVPHAPADVAGWRADAAAVFALLAEVEQQLVDADELAAPDGTLDIDDAIDTLLEFSAALPDELVLVAGLGVPGRWPLPVIVSVTATGENPDDLLEAAGARGGLPVDLPTVDYLPDDLGDGIRVTRFDLDDDGAIWATVACARRSDGTDTVLTWRTSQLELVPLFSPLIEELLAHVRIGPAL